MTSEKIESGLNWLILSSISNNLLTETRNLCLLSNDEDFKDYTSAEGSLSKQNYITQPPWKEVENFQMPQNWANVEKRIIDKVKKELRIHNEFPERWYDIKTNSAWTVLGEKGSYHTVHDHGVSTLSVIIYTDTPENQQPPNGCVFFIMHSDSPSQFKKIPCRIFHVNPCPGMMIIFPSHLIHGVYPQDEGVRRTLNIDFDGIILE